MISIFKLLQEIKINESYRLYDYLSLIKKWVKIFNGPTKDPFNDKELINKIKDVYSSLNTLNKIKSAKEYCKLISKTNDNSDIKNDIENWVINRNTIRQFDGIIYNNKKNV